MNDRVPDIIQLDDGRWLSHEVMGYKAVNLHRLLRAGFSVPRGFCVTTAAFRRVLDSLRHVPAEAGALAARLRESRLPPDLWEEIAAAYQALAQNGGGVAVRSSATGEDSPRSSGAGQQASFLNVCGTEQVIAAIRNCWASLFTPESILYHGRPSDLLAPLEMAVIVQSMVQADTAGVLFTVNPLGDGDDEMLINSAFGLGDAVASGRAVDTYRVGKATGQLRARDVSAKATMTAANGAAGVAPQLVPAEKVEADSLGEEKLQKLAGVGRAVEELFDLPQDIEWAIRDGTIYLLQARPIIGLTPDHRQPARVEPEVWSNINVGEALPGVGTPITWSVIRSFSRLGFERAFGALGLKVPAEYELVGSFRGRVYLNLTQFMSVASQVPFFNPGTLLSLGGGGGLPGLAQNYRHRSPWGFLLRLPLTIPRMLGSQVLTPWQAPRWQVEFGQRRAAFYRQSLAARAVAELQEQLDEVTKLFEKTGTVMLSCAANALSSYVLVSWFIQRWRGGELAAELPLLFSGLTSISSAAPGLELLAIAHQIRAQPGLAQKLRTLTTAAGLKFIRQNQAAAGVRAALDDFLARHGHRAPREAEISTPRWHDDPAFLVGVLQAHLKAPQIPDPEEIAGRQRAERLRATAHVLRRLGWVRSLFFRPLLALAQQATRLREAMRTSVIETLSMYHTLFKEIGRRAAAATDLDDPDDVWFLALAEIRDYLAGKQRAGLRIRIAVRKSEYAAYCRNPGPPDTFVLRAGALTPADDAPPVGSLSLLKGLPGSPGRATGRARVLHDPSEAALLQPGEVLVAPQTDIGWTPLFLIAGGLATDLGGPLSHSCIVAREYGIPTVVNLKQATMIIRTGDLITVDGYRGLVYLAENGQEKEKPA